MGQRFHTTVELGGKTATGIPVPDEIVAGLGAGKRPAVRVTIGNHTYRSTVATMRGRFMLPISAAVRSSAGVAAGDEVDVEIELDTAPREVDVPADFAAALAAEPAAKRAFEQLAFTHRKEHVRAIEDAKKPETRERRIASAITKLRDS
jgi:hypothetical protein